MPLRLPPPDLIPPEVRPVPFASDREQVRMRPPHSEVRDVALRPYVPEPDETYAGRFEVIKDALSYPLRGGNAAMLVLAAMFSLGGLSGLPWPGWGAVAYFGVYTMHVVARTLDGKDDAPEWPSFSSFSDEILHPGSQMLAAALASVTPSILVEILVPNCNPWHFPLLLLGETFVWLYWPMAMLAVIANGTAWAVLPTKVIPAIFRCMPGYLVCAGGVALVEGGLSWIVSRIEFIPVLGTGLALLVMAYLMLAQARLAGLIYLRYAERLPW